MSQVTLELNATSVAIVPLVVFISGFVASLLLERGKNTFGKRTGFYIGFVMALAGCLWIKLGSPINVDYTSRQIYGVAILIGRLCSAVANLINIYERKL